jgi:hypothetical protein
LATAAGCIRRWWIGGIAMNATQMLVIAIIMPTIVRDIGGASFYTWAAMLYTIGSIVGGASTAMVMVAPWRTARLYARLRRFRGWYIVLCAGTGHWLAYRGSGSAGMGRRAGLRKRHGADCQPVRRAVANPHHCDLAKHLHGLPSEWTDCRRRLRRCIGGAARSG